MPSTVLGKRARHTVGAADAATTRSKRRILLLETSDENRNPFVSHRRGGNGEDEEQMEVNDDAAPAKKTRGSARSVPAKHGAPERRIEVAPAAISTHFRSSKPIVDVYQDGKGDRVTTPQTPRHRDALSKKVPVTPRHRLLLAGSPLLSRTPRTPPCTPFTSTGSVYNQARQLFSRCSNPGKLVGREAERQELSGFIQTCMEAKSAGCLYVSGPPGTGKSAFVQEVARQYDEAGNLSQALVNCMSVRSGADLSQKLMELLSLEENANLDLLRSCFLRGQGRDDKKYLVILDEVDRLVDLDLDLLYNLFEWSMQPASRLILIGIANALDLTDRFLPRLKSRGLRPQLLPFMPYTTAQIADVLTSKLKTLCAVESPTLPFLHPAAIQFCAKKVAAQTGDLRKAFDLCRRAVDLVDQETREKDAELHLLESPSKTPLMENTNLSSPPTSRSPGKTQLKSRSVSSYTIENAPKATIAHMAKVTALVFGNGTTQRLATLNLQQKAVLCALAALEKRKRETQVERTMFSTPSKTTHRSAPSVKQLFDAYSSLCNRDHLLHPLTGMEFRDVVSGLETLSLLLPVDGKSGSFALPVTPSHTPSRRGRGGGFFGAAAVGDDRKVASVAGYKELLGALDGPGGELLRDLLDGAVLL